MILITSDLHLSDNPRDGYRHAFMKEIVREIKKRSVRMLLILGDLCQEKDRHGAELTTQVFSYIKQFASLCRVVVLKGNHDYLVPSVPFFRSLGHLDNVSWINEPTELSVLPGVKSLFLPHTRDYKKDWQEIRVKDFDLIFTHNVFGEVMSDSGQILKGIPRSVFSKRQMVIGGDVHLPQKVGVVDYVGAPYDITFTSVPCDRRMILLSVEDGTIKKSYISCKGPRKIVMDLSLGEKIKGNVRAGDMIKVRVHLKPGESLGDFRTAKEELAKRFESCIIMVQPVLSDGAATVRTRSLARSDESVLRAYASSLGVGRSVLKTGLRLMGSK
jgi:predicted phosphodiesterase